MIITLADAQTIDPTITQDRLDSYETAIRAITHNNFQLPEVRGRGLTISGDVVTFDRDNLTEALLAGDTVQLGGAGANDGLYTAKSVADGSLTLSDAPRLSGYFSAAIVTLVQYPADVKEGVRRLIEYDKKMASKTGVKSETISRMSVTYYDANSAESVSGYPANLMSFVKKYAKMYWG